MTTHARKHLIAWLGILAMCLIVFAPVVSQLLVSARAGNPDAILCSATLPPADAALHDHGGTLAACGYCDLLADQPGVPTLPAPQAVLIVLVMLLALPVPCTRFTPIGAFPSGQPRAPPAFRQISL
ncbi:hypothetical protein DR64_8385 [Paraburkholderia xenovorans LB400]|uniref:DUF2946 domain-containing protein n=1 Tax=Paraburkholderia xenovorans (strain LB400) TaxID=266265 RepID=Q13IX2_PARXL|nr:DUF2946 domain-containing protein [Paraburkholderia xenovorans]ABE35967.1 Conserved hypothetical protein [Paraburkholderia xenovorans LB400]AIP34579.1 hypothetical protein DR64_8385 [Paraburkholderia xenovorans LB400]